MIFVCSRFVFKLYVFNIGCPIEIEREETEILPPVDEFST